MRGNDAHPTCFRLLLSLILPLVRPLLLPLLFLSFLLRYHKLALWATLVFFSYGSQLQLGVALLISTMKVRTVVWSIVNMIVRTHCCCVVWYYIVLCDCVKCVWYAMNKRRLLIIDHNPSVDDAYLWSTDIH